MGIGSLNEDHVCAEIERVYNTEYRRVYASLVRLLGDLDLAEEALHEAFATAVTQWARDGIPDKPRAWLISTGRFKAIDSLRRRGNLNQESHTLWGDIVVRLPCGWICAYEVVLWTSPKTIKRSNKN